MSNRIKVLDTSIDTIYVATDNENIITTIRKWQQQHVSEDFNFVFNDDVRRMDNGQQWEWMFQGHVDTFSILLDLVLFKEAQYIVGSQTSNVFRLATALNAFHHRNDKKRAYEIDSWQWQPGVNIKLEPVCERCANALQDPGET